MSANASRSPATSADVRSPSTVRISSATDAAGYPLLSCSMPSARRITMASLDTASSRNLARQATLAARNSFPPTIAHRGKNPPTCAGPQPMRTECWSPYNARPRGITRSTLSIANNPWGFHGIGPPQESRCPWHFATDIIRRQVNNDRGLRVTAHRVSKLLKTLTHER